MSEPWIRVHATLIDKPVVARAAEALGVSEHAAVGLLVTFWGGVSRSVVGGSVSDTTDAQLEQWARWRGKRGKFAAFIRAHHLDADGRVREWDDYAGALEARREKERQRLANKRNLLRNKSDGVAQQTQDVATHARERDGTKRNEGTASSSREMLLAAVPHRETWEAELNAAVQGMHGPALTPKQLEAALTEYIGNGEITPPKIPNLRHFRAYLARAAKPPKPVGSNDNGRATLLVGKIRGLVKEHYTPGQGTMRAIRRDDVAELGPDVLEAFQSCGGSSRFLQAEGEAFGFLLRDFAAALTAAGGHRASA